MPPIDVAKSLILVGIALTFIILVIRSGTQPRHADLGLELPLLNSGSGSDRLGLGHEVAQSLRRAASPKLVIPDASTLHAPRSTAVTAAASSLMSREDTGRKDGVVGGGPDTEPHPQPGGFMASPKLKHIRPSDFASLIPAGVQNCSSVHYSLSQDCLLGGRAHQDRFFVLKNVEYLKGDLSLPADSHYKESRAKIRLCWVKCRPTLLRETLKQFPETITPRGQRTHMHNHSTCQRVAWSAITHDSTINFYHFIVDRLFLAFVTIVNLGRYLGRPVDSIEIYHFRGPLVLPNRFKHLWLKLLPPVLSYPKNFSGCFSHVFYGSFYRSLRWHNVVPAFKPADIIRLQKLPSVLLDRQVGSWLKAFSLNQRHRWLGMSASSTHDDLEPFILPYHVRRETGDIWEFEWEAALSKLNSRIRIVRHELANYSFSQQAAIIQQVKGMVGATGAQFSWLLWMKPNSAALIIHRPEIPFTCEFVPRTFFDGIAINIGHTFVSWKICGKYFPRLQAAPVLNFLGMVHEEAVATGQAKACWILRDHKEWWKLPSRKWCDLNVSSGWDDRLHKWPPYPWVGGNLADGRQDSGWLKLRNVKYKE